MTDTKRQRLIDAAFELFDERGFEQTTVDDIAERAGVGRTTFFRNFRAKEEVIFPEHDEILAAISSRLATASPDTATVALTEAARIVLMHYLAEGGRARSRYALTSSVPALRDREVAGMRQYQRLFRDFIRTWMGDGHQAALRAELMSNAVVTAHNYVLRRWLREQTITPEDDFTAAMAEVLDLFTPRTTREQPKEAAVLLIQTRKDLRRLLPEIEKLVE